MSISVEKSGQVKLVFGFMDSTTTSEALLTSYGLWDFLKKDYELKSNCKLDLEDTVKRIGCKQSHGADRTFWLKTIYLPKHIKELINA